jgi:hypothetical protein
MRAAYLLLSLATLVSCGGSGGAVSVRWRIIDVQTGVGFDPHDVRMSDDSCSCAACPNPASCATCAPNLWIITRVHLRLADPNTGAPFGVDPSAVTFSCATREATTPFVLPVGNYALSLDADAVTAPGQACPRLEVITPAPLTRTIVKGEVVNLDVIEIGVDPLPLPCSDAGVMF